MALELVGIVYIKKTAKFAYEKKLGIDRTKGVIKAKMEVMLGGPDKLQAALQAGEVVTKTKDGIDFYFDREIEAHRES